MPEGRFEYRVGQACIQGQYEGDGTGQTDRSPAGNDHQESITDAKVARSIAHRPVNQRTGKRDRDQTGYEGHRRAIIIEQRKHQWWHETQA